MENVPLDHSKAKKVAQPKQQANESDFDEEDSDTSSDDDCNVVPKPGYYFAWKRDSDGEKYFDEIPLQVKKDLPQMVLKYVKDEKTGRSYRRLVPNEGACMDMVFQSVIDPSTGKVTRVLVPAKTVRAAHEKKNGKSQANSSSSVSSRYLDHRVAPGTPEIRMKSGLRTPQQCARPVRGERLPTFMVPTEEKQGRESKVPDIVQYARNCPVAWTSKITSEKLNMGLWCWAFISDLLATRTGFAPTLEKGVLEARMQHFLNTLEVALQSSNPTEFDAHSWHVARLYAEKVQQKIDRGASWLHLAERYGEDSHPHELMAAREELAFKLNKKKPEDRVDRHGTGDRFAGKKVDDKKYSCTTWNTSLQEGKCDWEAQNEGRNCDRRHECTWCKGKGKRSLHHQKTFCRQRIAAGEQ